MNELWNYFWILIIVFSFMPFLQQKILHTKRLAVMKRLENSRKSRVITLIHRQEVMKLLGFPLMRYIDINDSEQILRVIRMTPDDMPIDLVLHTPGGLV